MEARRWQKAEGPPISIAVNISARQLHDVDLVRHVVEALDAASLAASLLELEITETSAMQNPAVTIQTLNTFDLILPLTGGGPARRTEVVSLFMYRAAFSSLEAGRAAAVAVILLVLNLVLALLAARLIQRGRAA